VRDVGREIFEEILAVASGKRTKSEQLGIGDEEFVPCRWDRRYSLTAHLVAEFVRIQMP